jgi:Fusaric acid resistance protein-like
MRSLALRNRVRERFDALLAFDPGLNQLLLAAAVMAGVAVSVGAVYLYCQAVHPMWMQAPPGAHLSAAQAAALGAQHHGETLLAMLIGGIVGMLAAFAVVDTDRRQLLLTFALMPVPMLATLALAVQFTHDRTLGIVCMALVMGVGAYLPKFAPRIGPRAFVLGNMLFIGFLFGFLSRGAVTTADVGPIAGILWFSAAVNLVLKLVVFLPLREGALRRTVRAFFARGRGVLNATLRLWDAADLRERERLGFRLHRRLTRLNETALIADALLGDHAAIADDAHARLFDAELGLQNIGRLADALAGADLPLEVRTAIRDCLAEVLETHVASVGDGLAVLRRFGTDPDVMRAHPLEAGRVIRLADALVGVQLVAQRWEREITPPAELGAGPAFEPPVTLVFGNLPGSTVVSGAAAVPPGTRRARFGLDRLAQNAIRITVAVAAAAAIGSVVSERRFYWAVLAVFVSYMGANTSGEQIFKAVNRVAGTVVGIFLGSLVAHAIGASTWSLLVVVLALGFGIYFMRASYALMVIGITVTVSQLYVQLGEFSNSLLVLRLEETAIGAAVATLAALIVFPLRTRAATRVAARAYYDELQELLARIAGRLAGDGGDGEDGQRPLSALTRSLDSALHQLRAAAIPLALTPARRDEVRHNMLLYGQAAHHARNLAAQLQRGVDLSGEVVGAARTTLETEDRLVATLAQLLELSLGTHQGAALETEARRGADLAREVRETGDLLSLALDGDGTAAERQFLRHLARLDETLAELADNLSAGAASATRRPRGPRDPRAHAVGPPAGAPQRVS